MGKIMVTGSEGLIGRSLCKKLKALGEQVVEFDIQNEGLGDVTCPIKLENALSGVEGIIHLAAVSRVIWGERCPEVCREVNIGSVRNLDALIRTFDLASAPWLIFASSREVYGEQKCLPVPEDAELQPMNVYAHTKVKGEQIVQKLSSDGYVANVVRLSNVYGDPVDHPDRVVPAFARAAAFGGTIRIEGKENTFDFTHVDDVTRGLVAVADRSSSGRNLDPIHFVGGHSTSLAELAEIVSKQARADLSRIVAPPRNFDVSRFVGCPKRAIEELGWTADIDLVDGIASLVQDIIQLGQMDSRSNEVVELATREA